MTLVVDASVAVKWFLKDLPDEQHAYLALQILERSVFGFLPLVQPPHFVAEVAAVLTRLNPTDAQDDLLDLLEISYRTLASPEIYLTALDLATRYQHHMFDTLYLAVALHTLMPFWLLRTNATTTKPGLTGKSFCWQTSSLRSRGKNFTPDWFSKMQWSFARPVWPHRHQNAAWCHC